jgi:hypothetical protein
MTNHPITPPLELVQQWMTEFYGTPIAPGEACTDLANRAAQWGADQELEACCALLEQKGVPAWSLLRLHRRPKPPSLKKQALDELVAAERLYPADWSTIRRALEALPND